MSKTVIFNIGGVYFCDGIFSHLVKRKKPDPVIYQLILAKASHPAEACIFIDDKPGLLKPAQDLGMAVIAFKNSTQLENELKALLLFPDGHQRRQCSGVSNSLIEESRIQEFRYYWYSIAQIQRY